MRRVKENSRKSIQEVQDERQMKVEPLIEKWKKHPRIGKNWNNLNEREQELTAVLCENQERHLKALNETTISSAFGLTPEKVIEVVRLSAPNANRGNIFREIPMLSTDDAFTM
jgi:wobble nucleotide-excising tRNase